MSPLDIIEFGRLMREAVVEAYDERLWAAACMINEGCGDDSFSDFCHWLVFQGEQVYEKVLAETDSLSEINIPTPEVIFDTGFRIGSAAFDAYKMKVGTNDFSERVGILPQSAWRLKNEGIVGEEEEFIKNIIPKLYDKFYRK
jgi:hypothetical protein